VLQYAFAEFDVATDSHAALEEGGKGGEVALGDLQPGLLPRQDLQGGGGLFGLLLRPYFANFHDPVVPCAPIVDTELHTPLLSTGGQVFGEFVEGSGEVVLLPFD
jgi:hypothetical protein